ncbi:transmembrane protein 47-like [Saccostrea cucullata]|uniref:transmembrane protein 47-like n=1 Tax=Saccostrea cuccullata TaxID=36930 RepID=UPI002ED66D20
MDTSKILLIAVVLTACSVIFQVIGLASPYWIHADVPPNKLYSGLWKACLEEEGRDSICKDLTNTTDWLEAVRTLSILGLLALLVSSIAAALKLFIMKEQKQILLVAIAAAFAGAIFILISIAVYAAKINEINTADIFKFHFAFAFCILAMLEGLGGGALMLIEMMK